MAFLSGSVGFERFQVVGSKAKKFSEAHLEVLERFAIGKSEMTTTENVQVGFLAGGHLLDNQFYAEKNIINNALHFGIRVDSNQIPAALRRAWMQIELSALMSDNPLGRPTRAQREEAKEGVERRCDDELQTGKYLRMQAYPVLWDARQHLLYFGGSSASALNHCADLFERAFEVELERINASWLAMRWAERTKRIDALHETDIATFNSNEVGSGLAWANNSADDFSFLGNEFLLWLWWYLETQSDTVTLEDDTEATLMMARTLQLECPWGEWGREVLTAECPIRMPEATQAIRSGKLPRKAGLILVRDSQQFEFVLQAETFAISGAKIQLDEPEEHPQDRLDSRIDSVRCLAESVDLLFEEFCKRRMAKGWTTELKKIRRWIQLDNSVANKPAA